LKDENYENSEQLNNESLSMNSGFCGLRIDSTGDLQIILCALGMYGNMLLGVTEYRVEPSV